MLKNKYISRKKFFKRLPTGKIFRGKLRPKELSLISTAKIFSISKPNKHKRLRFKLIINGLVIVLLFTISVVGVNIFRPTLPKVSLDFITQRLVSSLPKNTIAEVKKEKSFEEQIAEQLNPDLFKMKETKAVEAGVEFDSAEGMQAIFSKQKDPTEQVTSLQTVLSRARIDGRKVKKIDFRFDKLVVEYQ
ncbi:MAG: hypothetical protein M1150_00080 [Patescibacteria group bacterium]|nr:hypothetical protein [Patescibacteria group bacterium]